MCSNTQVEREHGNSTEGTRPKDRERERDRENVCVCACVKDGDPLLHIFTLQTQYTQSQTHYVYRTSSPTSDLLYTS